MENRINNKYSLLLILFLNLLIYVKNEIDDETYIKALSCVNVITESYKQKGENPEEPNLFSPEMLSCFIRISPDKAQEIISNMDLGETFLDSKEIYELTNTNILRDFTQEELNIKKKELENAIDKFEKMEEDNDSLSETNSNDNSKKESIWDSITNIIDKIFITRSTNNFWIALVIITVLMCTLFYMKNDEKEKNL